MIEVETTTALLLYLALFLLLCFGAWILNHLKHRNRETLPPLFLLSKCEYCHFDYLSKNGMRITTCPQCGSYNKSAHST